MKIHIIVEILNSFITEYSAHQNFRLLFTIRAESNQNKSGWLLAMKSGKIHMAKPEETKS